MVDDLTSSSLPAFVSRQVLEARRFFLNLDPHGTSAVEVVCGGVERLHTDYLIDRRTFPYRAIELVAEGEGLVTINGKEHSLSAGSMFAYGPGVSHTIRNQGDVGMRKYYLDFVGTAAVDLLGQAGMFSETGEHVPIAVGRLHEVAELFDMLIRDASEGGPHGSELCVSLTRLLFLKIQQLRLSAGSVRPKAYATYERIRNLIDENYLELQTAQDVAEACELTPVYLSRLFGRFSDCGVYQYLLRRKMNYAAGLLMNEGMLVKEVAEKMEFPDPFQFSRSFKRVYGVPPTRLVNQVR